MKERSYLSGSFNMNFGVHDLTLKKVGLYEVECITNPCMVINTVTPEKC